MSVAVDPHDEPGSVHPGGPVTLSAAGEIADPSAIEDIAIHMFALPPAVPVVVDLSAVTYLSMEAIAPLVLLARHCVAEGRRLRIESSEPAHRKLVTMGLDRVIPLAGGAEPGR
ncbi:STAS domain-containing protein [Amycolatopsis sp. NPDC004378]